MQAKIANTLGIIKPNCLGAILREAETYPLTPCGRCRSPESFRSQHVLEVYLNISGPRNNAPIPKQHSKMLITTIQPQAPAFLQIVDCWALLPASRELNQRVTHQEAFWAAAFQSLGMFKFVMTASRCNEFHTMPYSQNLPKVPEISKVHWQMCQFPP